MDKFTAKLKEIEEVLRSRDRAVDRLAMIHQLSKYDGPSRQRRGIRISSVGKHPLIGALDLILDPTVVNRGNMEHYVTESGDMFEAWVMGKLSQYDNDRKWFRMINGVNKVTWKYGDGFSDNISGHPDVIVEVDGDIIVLDVKHTNSNVARDLLKPATIVSNKTGNDVKVSNEWVSELSDWALENDDRGYIVQVCCYAEALRQQFCKPVTAGLIMHVKDCGKTYVVGIPDDVRARALEMAKRNIEMLRKVAEIQRRIEGTNETFADVIQEITAIVGAPHLRPQISKGQRTGHYYTPISLRSYPEWILDYIYGGHCGGGYEINPQWDGVDTKNKYRPVPSNNTVTNSPITFKTTSPFFNVTEFPEVS